MSMHDFIYRFDDYELQPKEGRLLRLNEDLALGSRTLDLLTLLVHNAGKLVTKESIFATLWPHVVVEENNLHVHISMLRKVLGNDKIVTLSGKGYRFTIPVKSYPYAEHQHLGTVRNLKIILLDDHLLIREAMCGVLRELVSDVVVLEAVKASDVRNILKQVSDIHLLILDLGLPDICGLEFLKELRQSHPHLPIVVMSGMVDQKKVLEVVNSGALGFIPKATSRQVMISAMKQVLAGNVYIPEDLFRPANPIVRF
jgi:DNA-binding response OmpR family regulator